MQRDIKHTWFYPHAPETVWEFLTDQELLSEWFMENDFKPEVGHKFKFWTKPKIKLGFDGIIYGEVTEIIPFEKLSYSWKGGSGKGKITLDSMVTWTLTQKDGGTELKLEHTGFRGIKNYITYLIMNKGWVIILKKKLLNKINTRHAKSQN